MTYDIEQLIALVVAVVTAILALIKYVQANADRKATVTFYTEGNVSDATARICNNLPPGSWTMGNEVKKYILSGETPEDQNLILSQIAAAEMSCRTDYQIVYSKGWYTISFGQIRESGRGK